MTERYDRAHEAVRVFVNGRGVDVHQGATALDAVRAVDEGAAAEVEAGTSRLTDSRGLPAMPGDVLVGGSILRVVPVRERRIVTDGDGAI